MNSWKSIGQIALLFGIISVIFAAIQAFITYQAIAYQYGPLVPAGFIQINLLNSMLPFLLFAVLSFAVAAVTMRSGREEAEQNMTAEPQSMEAET